MFTRHFTVALMIAGAACLCMLSAEAAGSPTDAERAALDQFKGHITGRIVWASNRTDHWELYTMNADGTGARQLTHLSAGNSPALYTSYLRPRLSPDGATVLFAYGRANALAEVWLASTTTGEASKLTVGNPLNWSPDGTELYFVRESQVWRHVLATAAESLVHEAKVPVEDSYTSMVGAVRADLKAAVFRTKKKNDYFVFDEGKTVKTTDGCEPGFTADGRYMFWVQGPKDFRIWDIANDEEHELLGTPTVEPYNYTYCPTLSVNDRWILYGASPSEHSHTTSDYEIYIQEMRDYQPVGQPGRLTFNPRTDRWATLWVGPNPLPAVQYDVAGNPLTLPPALPLAIATFGSEGAAPDWGGDSGLWPQTEGCKADLSFVAGDDPETGKGGSVALDYTIAAEPRSFSMWFAPQKNVDLSRYDRFTIYARGDVPSFTLVVKDASAAPEGKTDAGIAEYLVAGVTANWQRFELPLTGFQPRVQGTSLDWSRLNHVGVALVQPQNAASGSLHVDNLRALPPATD